MRVTIQTNATSNEYGSNLFQSDPIALGTEDDAAGSKMSFETLHRMYSAVQTWSDMDCLVIPIDRRLWSFNPVNVVRVCIMLTGSEEKAYKEWVAVS